MTREITVVIATLNEEQFIEALLDSVDKQTLDNQNIEIILVDGKSEDSTLEAVVDWALRTGWAIERSPGEAFSGGTLRILENPEKRTPIAFNIGIAAASSDWVVIVGAHSIVEQNFLAEAVDFLTAGLGDIVGGVMSVASLDPAGEGFALAQTSVLATGGAGYRHAPDAPTESDTVPFPAFSKALWQELGGFDEELLRNQDDDFVLRARTAGSRVMLHPGIRFTYFVRPNLARLWKQYFQYGEYRIQTIYKRRKLHSLRPLAPLGLVSVFATLPLLRFTRFQRLAPAIVAGYVAAVSLESLRITGPRPATRWIQCITAIATMQIGYGLGQLVGLFRLARGAGRG